MLANLPAHHFTQVSQSLKQIFCIYFSFLSLAINNNTGCTQLIYYSLIQKFVLHFKILPLC